MEKHYAFRDRLQQVHMPDRVNPDIWTKKSGVVVTEDWTIAVPDTAGELLRTAADDLADYFKVSMRVTLGMNGTRKITISVDSTLPERAFRIRVGESGILITGHNEKAAAQGIYALEDEMNLNEGPIAAVQDTTRQMRFTPRVIHSGLGSGMYPDAHLSMLAHAGMDAIMLGTGAVLSNSASMERVNDVIRRAARYGIDVYTFSPFHNARHPSDPDAWEHYDAMYGRLFTLCPGLRGMFIVGESCEFPSHDPRTTGKTWRESLNDEKPSPGWFPCDDYPEFISLLRDVIRSHKPDADIIFWTYNWGYIDESLRVKLLENVPADITIMATFEMFQEFDIKPGVREVCTDYTLWFIGPGTYFRSESEVAARRGLRMYSMTNSGGNTWDIGDVPYLPAPQRWIERWKAITNAQDTLRLDGVMESHTYGFWPSIMPELEKYAYMIPTPDLNELLRKLVVRDFGEENADTVLKAFALYSEGMAHCVSTNEDQYGPCRIGPAYPLFFRDHEPLPIGPESKKNPNNTCNPVYRYNLDLADKLIWETGEYETMAKLFAAGNTLLEGVVSGMSGQKRAKAERLLGVARFIERTARTTVNVKKWHLLKGKLGIYVDTVAIWTGGRKGMPDAASAKNPPVAVEDPRPVLLELLDVAYDELANAEATIPLVEADSRLGYTQELDYCGSAEQIRWKLEKTRRAMDEVAALL